MLIATGKMEKLTASKGSEIEVTSEEYKEDTGYVWYRAILKENLSEKNKWFLVRCIDPLLKQDYSPPLFKKSGDHLIRPVPPPDPFPDLGFEEGDVIDTVHDGAWMAGSVIRVLENGHYLVYLKFKPEHGAIEVERKDMRSRMVWKDDEWFLCEKQQLIKEDISNGTSVEVRTEVEKFGDVWSQAKVIKENEDGTLLVKLSNLREEEEISTERSLIRPAQQNSFGIQIYNLMEKVEACVNSSWCPGVVSKVLTWDQYVVVLGPRKLRRKFYYDLLRSPLQWKDGVWVKEEKGPEETTVEETVSNRKRGRPGNFISTEPKQKTGVAVNGSKAATIRLTNMTDDNRPLASSGQSVSQSPDPMLNSFVENPEDFVETPPSKESIIVLPFAKNSPAWKVLESMEVFKLVPQHPHFSPLLESEVESREGDAIGKMVMYTGLLEELKNLQVDHPMSSIKRIDECLLKLEKHGFNVTEPRSRIAKLLVVKERQTRTLEEFKAVEEQITTSNNKRRKYEENIVELQTEFQRREAVLKEAKAKLDTEIARMQSDATLLDHKVQTVDQDFQAIVNAPW